MDESPNKRRSRLRLFVVAISVCACLGWLVYLADRPKNGIRIEQLEADLNTQLPYGSTWEQAEAWFASHGLQPSYISPDGQTGGLGVIIPNDRFLETAEIRITLYFNAEKRLVKRIISRFVVSL